MIFRGLILATVMSFGSAAFAENSISTSTFEIETDTAFAHVYFVPDPNAVEFRTYMIFDVGETDMEGAEGIAHYIEHLMVWNAMPNRDENSQRDFNAYTTKTFTAYFYDSADLDEALNFLRGVFNPMELDEDFMQTESDIVRREFALSFSDDKYALPIENYERQLYAPSPMQRSVIGSTDNIAAFDPANAEALIAKFYHPENATLLISGNMTEEAAVDIVNAKFGDIPSGLNTPRQLAPEPELVTSNAEIQTVKDLPNPYATASWVFPCDDQQTPSFQATLAQAQNIITSSKEGGFVREIEYDTKTHNNTNAYFELLPDGVSCTLRIDGAELNQTDYIGVLAKNWATNIETQVPLISDMIAQNTKTMQKRLAKKKPRDDFADIQYTLESDYLPLSDADYFAALSAVSADDVISLFNRVFTARQSDLILRKEN